MIVDERAADERRQLRLRDEALEVARLDAELDRRAHLRRLRRHIGRRQLFGRRARSARARRAEQRSLHALKRLLEDAGARAAARGPRARVWAQNDNARQTDARWKEAL